MRLFEADVRTDSITAAASGASCNTQASSFSLCSRSGTFPVSTTDSIANCLKQSASKARPGSLRSTRATLAEAFLLRRGEARAVPDDFCMTLEIALKLHSGPPSAAWQRDRRPMLRYKGVITRNELTSGPSELLKLEFCRSYVPGECANDCKMLSKKRSIRSSAGTARPRLSHRNRTSSTWRIPRQLCEAG